MAQRCFTQITLFMEINNITVSVFPNIAIVNQPTARPLMEVLDDIKTGAGGLVNKVKKIRSLSDHKEQDKHKVLLLPVFCPCGVFQKREDKGLVTPSNAICIDLDDVDDIDATILHLKQFPYVLSVFISPTGEGLKVIVLHDLADLSRHADLYHHLGTVMSLANRSDMIFDTRCTNVSRACFMSHSPEMYINPSPEVFHVEVENLPTKPVVSIASAKKRFMQKTTTAPTLTDDKEIKEAIIASHELFEKYYSMFSGTRNTNLFILASFFKDNGIPFDKATDYLVAYYVDPGNGFTADEIKKTVKSAYNNKP